MKRLIVGLAVVVLGMGRAEAESEYRVPIASDNRSSVSEPQLKQYLLDHANRFPWLYPRNLSVGAVGRFPQATGTGGGATDYSYKISQVVGDNSALIRYEIEGDFGKSDLFLIKNFDFSKYVDDKRIVMLGMWRVSGPYRYTTVAGASKTISAIEPFDATLLWKEVKAELEQQKVTVQGFPSVQTWKLKGFADVEGVFMSEKEGVVLLRTRLGSLMRIPSTAFSQADREWIKEQQQKKDDHKANLRTWVSSDGRQRMLAEFVKQEGSEVVLKPSGKPEIRVSWRNLSKADQKWIYIMRAKSRTER